jgi:hypothetical protein
MTANEPAIAQQLPEHWPKVKPVWWKRRSFWVWLVVALVVVTAIWMVVRTIQVGSHLKKARAEASALADELRAGSPSNPLRLATLQTQAAAAHQAAHDPIWSVYQEVPVLGRSFRTVRGLADALQTLSQDALPQTVSTADRLNTVRQSSLHDGLPITKLEGAGPQLDVAALNLDTQVSKVHALPHTFLVPGLGGVYAAATKQLDGLQGSVHAAADAAAIAPGVLGGHGERRYFVAFVNPAESRAGAGAGLFGAYAIVSANNGKLHVETVGSDSDLPNLPTPPPGVPAEYHERYGDLGGDVSWTASNLSPHYPYDAQTWAAMYKQVSGVQVDGVAALDPAALSVLLKGQPPLVLPGLGTITSANVVSFIESGEYANTVDPAVRKTVLKVIAKAVANRITEGTVPLSDLVKEMATATNDGHVRAMSLHPAEQARIANYPIAGIMPVKSGPLAAAFVTNSSSGKLEYYLKMNLGYKVMACVKAGRSVQITVSLRNGAPTSGLPDYVTARLDQPAFPVVPGQVRETVQVVLTPGASLTAATLDGADVANGEQNAEGEVLSSGDTERGHPIVELPVELKPGQTRVMTVTVTEPSGKGLTVIKQPLPRGEGVVATTAGGAGGCGVGSITTRY